MGEIVLPRRMFLWCMAVIYMVAFVSLYVQIPGETPYSTACVGASSLNSLLCASLLAWGFLLSLPGFLPFHAIIRGEEEPPGSFCCPHGANFTS